MWQNTKPSSRYNEMFLFQQLLYKWVTTYMADSGTTRAEQFFMPFHSNTMAQHQFLHILCYLHFTMTKKSTRKTTVMTNCVKLGKFLYSQSCVFEILQPFWTYGNWRGNCTFQREGCIQAVYPKETHTYLLHGAESFLSSWLACS